MKTLLSACWTHLMTATFEADQKLLQPYVPAGTELNDWNGKYLMSLVGFMFSKPSLYGIPSPFYRRFEEVNLRFYVRRKGKNGWKKGVVFIKEIAPSLIPGLAARWLYHERFIHLPMKHTIACHKDHRQVDYYWKIRQRWNFLKLQAEVNPAIASEHTMEWFIKEHFWGYTAKSAGQSLEFEIQHLPWQIYRARSFNMQLDAGTVYGKAFTDYFREMPLTAFLMDGSKTKVSCPVLL